MTTADTEMVLELLRAEYPHSFEKLTDSEKVIKIKTWATMFFEYDGETVLGAVRTFIENDTKGFAPSLGQIKQFLTPAALPEADPMTIAYRNNLKVYKAVTGRDYEPVDCIKEHYGYPKCEGCNEETKCRPAEEKKAYIQRVLYES